LPIAGVRGGNQLDAQRFAGRLAIVTGGSGGLGRAVVAAFLAEGAHVAAVARHDGSLAPLRRLPGADVSLLPLAVDLLDVSAVEQAVRAVRQWGGRLDILVNAAGAYAVGCGPWDRIGRRWSQKGATMVRSGDRAFFGYCAERDVSARKIARRHSPAVKQREKRSNEQMTRTVHRWGGRLGAGVVLAAALSGPLALPAMAQGAAAVSMTEDSPEHYAFLPSATTVPVGGTVTWTDMSDAPHTVTSDSGAFGSSPLNQNQTFAFTFSKAGTYTYHCSIHSYMHGTITVTAAAAAPAAAPAPASAHLPQAAAAAPAQVPARMPSTGAGGMAGASGGVAALLAGTAAVLAAWRRRR
jgi:plastocyanin